MDAQFFSCVPVKMLELPDSCHFSLAKQKSIIHEVFEHPLYYKYPPPISYQLSFLKWCISQIEAQNQEVCDELYELYGSLVSKPQPTHSIHCFKSYQISSKGQKSYITLKESINIISAGTTGLTTWQAAYYFVEWTLDNTEHFKQKHVLELGSGVGLVGMAMCRTCTPTSYCFTDCHPQVLSLLSSNIHLNSSDDGCGCEVSVREMDWSANADTILSSYSRPLDCIVTTDVVYDKEVIDLLVRVLAILMKHWPRSVAYVASTVRSEETYKYFCSKLDTNSISRQRMQPASPGTNIFYYDRSQHFEILKLDMKAQS